MKKFCKCVQVPQIAYYESITQPTVGC